MEDKSTSMTNSADSLGMMWGYRYRSSHKNVIIPRSLKDSEEKSESATEETDTQECVTPAFETFSGLASLKPDKALTERIFFTDQLQVVDKESEIVIGTGTIAIEKLGNEILAWGSAKPNDGNNSSFIGCVTNEQFSLLQERRKVYEDISLFYAQDDNGCTLITRNGSMKTERTIPTETSENFIGYGNAAAISRYMAVTKFEGTLFADYLMDDGSIISGTIEAIRSQRGTTVILRSDKEIFGRHELTSAGQTLRFSIKDRNYYFRANESKRGPFQYRVKEVFKAPKDDMQIRSLYEDRRMRNRAEGRAYVESQPELPLILANFVQNVLRFKPVNIIAFAVYHFAGFRKHENPEEDDDPNDPPEDAEFCLHVKQFHKPIKYVEETSEEEDISDEEIGPHIAASRSFIPGRSVLSRDSSRRLMFSYIDDLMSGTEAIRYIPDDLELQKVLEEQLDKEDFISYFQESINNDYLLSESEIRRSLKCIKDVDMSQLLSTLGEELPKESDDMQSTLFYSGENDQTVNINFDCSVKPYTLKDGTPAVFHNVRYEEWPNTKNKHL